MPNLSLEHVALSSRVFKGKDAFVLTIAFSVNEPLVFDVNIAVDIADIKTGEILERYDAASTGWDISWLPHGAYEIHMMAPQINLPKGHYELRIAALHRIGLKEVIDSRETLSFIVKEDLSSENITQFSWQLQSKPGTMPVEKLAWRRGSGDWFSKHFDHEVRTITSYLLGNSPLLKGKVLNVGCGDGTTDLGIALRVQPEEMVGVDPFCLYERLSEVIRQANMPLEKLPENLRFLPADANALPFPDDYFDVVLSWGSLEHIVGGYLQAFSEIQRVLKPGGLLMAHPGLFYSDIGNHLGEFQFARDEPYVHLKHSREWLKEKILASEPDRIDRYGDDGTSMQYWQWFTELNPITVDLFEQQLRERKFEPWRVALRTHDLVEYTPELQKYSFVDLAVGELYVSAYNRKDRK